MTLAAIVMRGDESYGRNGGYYYLLDDFRDIFERGNEQHRAFQDVLTGPAGVGVYRQKLLQSSQNEFVNGGSHQLQRPNFFIVPQGRCAEHLLFSVLGEMITEHVREQSRELSMPVIISNCFFDTAGANALVAGFELQTFTQPGLNDHFPRDLVGKKNLFKGNLDIAATKIFLDQNSARVSMILMTITNNWATAQPVSMANIRDTAILTRQKGVPLFFDACRFAENAFFIQRYEDGYSERTIPDIVVEMFSYVEASRLA